MLKHLKFLIAGLMALGIVVGGAVIIFATAILLPKIAVVLGVLVAAYFVGWSALREHEHND